MFTKLTDRRGVRNSDGFTVARTGSPITQFVIHYEECDGHSVDYPLENLMPGTHNVIRVGKIRRWKPPFEIEPIKHEKRLQIARRIVDGMNEIGDELDISEQ